MGLEIPPQTNASKSKAVINLGQFKLQRLQTQYSMQMTKLSIKMESTYRQMQGCKNTDEMLEALKKEEALLDSVKSAIEIDLQLEKEQEVYEAQRKADIEKAIKELAPKWAVQ